MSTLAVVQDVLRRARVPLTAQEIVTRARGRLPTTSKRPDMVVARDLALNLRQLGSASPFARMGPGLFTLRELAWTFAWTFYEPEPRGLDGRKVLDDKKRALLFSLAEDKSNSPAAICATLNISRSDFYRYLAQGPSKPRKIAPAVIAKTAAAPSSVTSRRTTAAPGHGAVTPRSSTAVRRRGGPPRLDEMQRALLFSLDKDTTRSRAAISKELGISRSSYYNYLNRGPSKPRKDAPLATARTSATPRGAAAVRRRGGPPRLNEKQHALLLSLAKTRTAAEISALFGISRSSYYSYLNRRPSKPPKVARPSSTAAPGRRGPPPLLDEKQRALLFSLARTKTAAEISAKFGFTTSTFYSYVARGPAELRRNLRGGQRLDAKQRALLLSLAKAKTKTAAEIAAKFGISRSSYYNYLNRGPFKPRKTRRRRQAATPRSSTAAPGRPGRLGHPARADRSGRSGRRGRRPLPA